LTDWLERIGHTVTSQQSQHGGRETWSITSTKERPVETIEPETKRPD